MTTIESVKKDIEALGTAGQEKKGISRAQEYFTIELNGEIK